MKRELTCIICPLGCNLEVGFESDDEKVISYIKGNTCKRGEEYARNESTCPKRTLTTTVAGDSGRVIPVKTIAPIPKEKMSDCMAIINNCKISLPISIGDVIIKDIAGTGVDVIATANAN